MFAVDNWAFLQSPVVPLDT